MAVSLLWISWVTFIIFARELPFNWMRYKYVIHSIKKGWILTFYTFHCKKRPRRRWGLFIVKSRLQGTSYSQKVVKSVFNPHVITICCNWKSGWCSNTLLTTFSTIKVPWIFYKHVSAVFTFGYNIELAPNEDTLDSLGPIIEQILQCREQQSYLNFFLRDIKLTIWCSVIGGNSSGKVVTPFLPFVNE